MLFLNLLPDVKYLLVLHVFLLWLMIIFIPHQEPSRRSWEPLSLWDAPSMAAIPTMSSMTSTAAKLSAHLSEQDTVPKNKGFKKNKRTWTIFPSPSLNKDVDSVSASDGTSGFHRLGAKIEMNICLHFSIYPLLIE